jgi:amidohydrolase
MPLAPHLADAIDRAVDADAGSLAELSHNIHSHPELRFQEEKAAAWVGGLVEARAHKIERGLGGMSTALRARAGKAGGPRVAILAEYDALPEIGHACGHNLIATSAVGAFLAAAKVAEGLGGEVVLLGTPAEEGGGGKIRLLEAGAFEGLDAAMMFHPFDRDLLANAALASVWIAFTFRGTRAWTCSASSTASASTSRTACACTASSPTVARRSTSSPSGRRASSRSAPAT